MIGAQLESQAEQVRWETKNVSLIVVVYLRKRPFYGLLCPTFKSTWLRLISLDKCEGEARVSSRKGKVLLSLKFKVRKYVAEISRCCLCMIGILSLAGRATLSEEVNFKENLRL